MKIFNPLILFFCCAFLACNEPENNEDKTKDINRNAGLETAIAVTHLDSTHDVITTTYKPWVNGANAKTITHLDTISSLGFGPINTKDKDGNEKTVVAQKDYEIFITVK